MLLLAIFRGSKLIHLQACHQSAVLCLYLSKTPNYSLEIGSSAVRTTAGLQMASRHQMQLGVEPSKNLVLEMRVTPDRKMANSPPYLGSSVNKSLARATLVCVCLGSSGHRRVAMFREAFQISAVYLLVLMGVRNCSARTLQQSFASAVSVSGGSGPFGNCGSTQTIGNAAVSPLFWQLLCSRITIPQDASKNHLLCLELYACLACLALLLCS